jgi:hypothetical protein
LRRRKNAGTAARPERHHFTPEVLAMAEKSLASYVGRSRACSSRTPRQVGKPQGTLRQLAAHIDSEEERRAFLASLQ